jgi:hypothetical protein
MEPFPDDEEDEEPEGAPNGASKLGIGRRRGNNENGSSCGAAGLAAYVNGRELCKSRPDVETVSDLEDNQLLDQPEKVTKTFITRRPGDHGQQYDNLERTPSPVPLPVNAPAPLPIFPIFIQATAPHVQITVRPIRIPVVSAQVIVILYMFSLRPPLTRYI